MADNRKFVTQNVVNICPPMLELETGQTALASLGKYKNIFLSEPELADLQTDLPTKWQHYIDRLSEYIASTGKQYKSHLAIMRPKKSNGLGSLSYL